MFLQPEQQASDPKAVSRETISHSVTADPVCIQPTICVICRLDFVAFHDAAEQFSAGICSCVATGLLR